MTTSSIRVPDTITKLSPDDTYPIVEGSDVGGFADLKTEVNANTSKIEANITNIANLVKSGKTSVYPVVGDNLPTYSTEPHGNYLVVTRAMSKRMDLKTPNPTGGMIDGAIFTVYNEDPTDSVMVRAGNSADKINGGSGVNIPPENFASFVFQLADRNFLLLESGYIPAARINIANYVEQKLDADGKLHTEAEIKQIVSQHTTKLGVDVEVDGSTHSDMTTLEFDDFTATVDPNDPKKITLTAPSPTVGDTGITVDDGTHNFASITGLKLDGISASQDPDGSIDTVTLTAHEGLTSWTTMGEPTYGGKADAVIVEPPLQVFADPNEQDTNRLRIAPGTFEELQAPGFLAYFDHPELLMGKSTNARAHIDGTVYPMDIVVDGGSYILRNMADKTIGIQEADQGDPNITGGTDYLVAFRVALEGVALTSGFVQIYLAEKAEFGEPVKIIKDVNGKPMSAMRYYKYNDKLGELEVVGIVNAKGLKDFTMHVVDSFDGYRLNLEHRSKSPSGIMLQALTKDSKTGKALLQYEVDTEQNIEFVSHYVGEKLMSTDWFRRHDRALVEGNPGLGETLTDGLHFYNLTKMMVGTVDGKIVFKDNGVDIADFNFGKIEDSIVTYAMRGKDIQVTTTLEDKNSGWYVALAKWTGLPDEYTTHVFSSRNADTPVFDANWSLVDSKFISEDIVDGDHTVVMDFTIPTDAVNFAVIIYPAQAQQPLELKLKEFKADAKESFTFYELSQSKKIDEIHLREDEEFYESVQDSEHIFISLRYTINDGEAGNPMPCGIQTKGKADITLDPSVNKVAGSVAKGGEGALKFGKAGTVTVNTVLNLRSEQAKGTTHPTDFWWVTVGPDGSMVEIPDSRTTFPVGGGTAGLYPMKEFTTIVEIGDRIALRAKSDMPDGAYLQADDGKAPLLDVKINFKELVADTSDDPFADIDLSQFDNVYTGQMTATKFASNTSSITFALDIPDGMNVAVLEAVKQMADESVRPVKKLDWVYSNKSKSLTVSFGETVTLGAVTIGVYV